MKNEIFSSLNKSLLIFLGFILLLIGFYWIQIRPTKIRKDCMKMVIDKCKEIGQATVGCQTSQAAQDLYEVCLHS